VLGDGDLEAADQVLAGGEQGLVPGLGGGPGQARGDGLPTPGGPMSTTLAASSRNRRVASSRISASSAPGWAEKS
jgi:hypothetical protein